MGGFGGMGGGFGGAGGFNPYAFGGMGGGNQPQDNTPPEEKYKTQEEQLQAMGFTNKQVNLQALQATGGNVEAAVERILNML